MEVLEVDPGIVKQNVLKPRNYRFIFTTFSPPDMYLTLKPTLDDYKDMYQASGYSNEFSDSLLSGLAKSSLYDSKSA